MHLLAINWQPEIRGVTVVLIAFMCLCGSVYLVMGTNLGARLGLLMSLAGLFGWLALMGAIWTVFGIGLKGKDPSWKPQQIFSGVESLAQDSRTSGLVAGLSDSSSTGSALEELPGGWTKLDESDSGRGQAASSSDEIVLNEAKRLGFTTTADYSTRAVYDKGGKRWPRLGPYQPDIWFVKTIDVDFLAFRHTPHYALVEIQPNVRQNTEPAGAPPKAKEDPSLKTVYVLMKRNSGYKRLPAGVITLGSGSIFAALAYMAHSRDKRSMAIRAGSGALVKA
jgi:hypothetical protein